MDVRAIQAALKSRGFYTGQVDGIAGKLTREAVKAFQKKNGLRVDGIAGPVTLGVLFPRQPQVVEDIPPVESGALLTTARMKRLWPNARAEFIAGIVAASGTVLPLHGLTTRGRLIHFLAQVSHECGGGRIAEENLNYSRAARIAQVWPSRFTTASAAPYVMNARALANKVYNGRMGNRSGTSDGYDYRGRGLIQITGRDGYAQVGNIAGLDLVGNPALANEPGNLLLVAAAFWTWKGLNKVCDRGLTDDVLVAVTKKVNGGTNGIADRRQWFAKLKREI